MAPEGFHRLVRLAQDGDRAAMDRVLETIRPHLEYMSRPYADPARPVESTADLMQDACLRAWRKIGIFEGGEDDDETFRLFRGWIGQIVRRLSLTARRDRGRQRRIPASKLVSLSGQPPGPRTTSAGMQIPSSDPSPPAQVRFEESVRLIQGALARIPDETEAEILRLRFVEEVSLAEVARRLGMTYKQALHRYNSALDAVERDVPDLI